MIGRADNPLAEQAATLLAEADPLRAARILARGLRLQSRGGRLAALRAFVRQLAEHDPAITTAITAELAAIGKE